MVVRRPLTCASCHAAGMDTGRGGALAGTEDDERWAQAQSVLDQQPTHAASARLRRRRQWALSAGIGATLVSVAVGVLIYALLSGDDGGSERADPPGWQQVAGLVVLGIGMVIEVWGLVVMWRAGLWRRDRWAVPAAVLTRGQRKSLLDQVRGRVPADPARLPLARDTARRMLRQRGLVGLFVGILLIQVGGAISSPAPWRTLMAGAFVVLYGVLFWTMERSGRRAQRFLAAHPDPAEAG